MRSDVPVGAYLSGGMDSSIVTLFAARCCRTGSRPSPARSRAERSSTRLRTRGEVAEARGAEMFECIPPSRHFVDLLPRLIYHMDEPAAGPGLFPQYIVSRLAAGEVKVVPGRPGWRRDLRRLRRYVLAYLEQALEGRHLRDQRGAGAHRLPELDPAEPAQPASGTCRCCGCSGRTGCSSRWTGGTSG